MDEQNARPSRRGTVTRIPRRGSGEDQRNYRALFRYVDPATGRVRTKSKDFKLKVDATRHLEMLRKEAGVASRSGSASRRAHTLREWLAEWHRRRLDPEEDAPIRPKTAELDRTRIKRLVAALGDRLISEIKEADVLGMLDQLREANVGRRTRDRVLATLRAALGEAEDEGWIVENPAERVLTRLKRKQRRERPESISGSSTEKLFLRDELTRILAAVDEPVTGDGLPDYQFSALIHLLAGSALRIGEALGLQWRDVDLDACVIHVKCTLTRDPSMPRGAKWVRTAPKTKASVGSVSIDAELVRRLRAFREWRTQEKGAAPHGTAFLFLNSVGKPCRAGDLRARSLYPLLDRLKISRERGRRSFHAFRHSHLSLVQEAGISLAATSERARHANPGITSRIYSHSSREASLEAAGAFRLALEAGKEKEVGGAF